MNGERCSEGIRGTGHLVNGKWVLDRCERSGKVTRDGKPYCKQHDPVARAQRDEVRCAERRARWEAQDLTAEFERLCVQRCTAAGVTLDDLRQGRVRVTVIPCEEQP